VRSAGVEYVLSAGMNGTGLRVAVRYIISNLMSMLNKTRISPTVPNATQ
jgi:hypothetical protein